MIFNELLRRKTEDIVRNSGSGIARQIARRSHPMLTADVPERSRVSKLNPHEIIFPDAKMDFLPVTFGYGGKDLQNAYRQGFVSPGDVLRVNPIIPEDSNIKPRSIEVHYVGPAEPFFDPKEPTVPIHEVLFNFGASEFYALSKIGSWERIEQEVPTHIRTWLQRRNLNRQRGKELSRLGVLINKLQGK